MRLPLVVGAVVLSAAGTWVLVAPVAADDPPADVPELANAPDAPTPPDVEPPAPTPRRATPQVRPQPHPRTHPDLKVPTLFRRSPGATPRTSRPHRRSRGGDHALKVPAVFRAPASAAPPRPARRRSGMEGDLKIPDIFRRDRRAERPRSPRMEARPVRRGSEVLDPWAD